MRQHLKTIKALSSRLVTLSVVLASFIVAFMSIKSFIFMRDTIFPVGELVSNVITPEEFTKMADNGKIARLIFRGDVETIVSRTDGKLYEIKPKLNSEEISKLRSKAVTISYEPARVTLSKIFLVTGYLLPCAAVILAVPAIFIFRGRRRVHG